MKRILYVTATCFILNAIASGQIKFSDVTNQSGLQFIGKNYGATVVDFDKDGWDDIFAFTQQAPCRLYHNNGNGTFTDIAAEVGVDYVGTPNVAGWADVNNDGWLDLMIGNRNESNVLYLGNEQGAFTENTFLSGLLTGGNVKALLFSDVNLDGKIDIYLARLNMENILYLNMGNAQFINFTNASGSHDNQISMGALFFDYDNDGDPDLYLTHDANQPFILYQNDGQGHFSDVSESAGADVAANGMGVDVADINNDGWMDIYVTNLYDNSLLVNNADGTFSEIAVAAGVNDFGMGWGCTFLDLDNDGWQDIYAVNDSYFSPAPNVLYRNNHDLTFETISDGTPLASLQPGYGTATGDFNNDGKVDIYLANYVGTVGNQLFRNDTQNDNNWVKIKAEGTVSNRAAIGARVTIETDGLLLTDEITGTSGYATQNSLTLHFGLGTASEIDKMTVRWPNGLVEIFENLDVNKTYFLQEGMGFTTPTFEMKEENATMLVTPNPFRNHLDLSIQVDSPNKANVMILNVYGEIVKGYSNLLLNHGMNQIGLDTDKFPAGVYFLRMDIGEKTQAIKLLKH